MRKILQTLVLLTLTIQASAQEAPEYRAEIGGAIGLVAYEGDFNGNPLRNQQPMLTLVGRYRLNPRMALAANISWGQLKGSSTHANTYYPDLEPVSFKHSVADIGMRYEYNFWPYGTGHEYRGAQRFTPYIYRYRSHHRKTGKDRNSCQHANWRRCEIQDRRPYQCRNGMDHTLHNQR